MNMNLTHPFEFVSIHYPFYRKNAIEIVVGTHSIEEYRDYIRENNLEMADIRMPDLDIIRLCPTLKYLKICPSINASNNFNFAPLYDAETIKSLNCQNQYGNKYQYVSEIDYAKINGLEYLSVSVNKGSLNYNKIETLKSLIVGGHKGVNCDLTDLFCSKNLDTLRLIQCKNTSLNGLGISSKMQCLYLDYNRLLSDITALRDVKSTLKALRIENCPKITDFSVLEELENLELLELSGNNSLPSLDFLKKMKNLKTFIFSMNVVDGDLSFCKNLSYVFSIKDRKHYNLKDKDLPKNQYYRGNDGIDEWRRLE